MRAIDRREGRHLFGADAPLYQSARPDYPERVYSILTSRCGLAQGRRVIEVGPGTGKATMRLLQAGARVVAVEPDQSLAEYLRAATAKAGFDVDLHVAPFEEEELPARSFDLGVAATSFHWVDQIAGLRKARRLLVAGGWWAMWWNVYADSSRPDPFYEATGQILGGLAQGPSAGGPGGPPFALDIESRTQDLRSAGFENIEVEIVRWTARLNTEQARALYSTFSPVARLKAGERERVLDEIASIAERKFGGRIERPFQTALYTCQSP